jgi:hypothetical protein
MHISNPICVLHAPPILFSIQNPYNIWWEVQIIKLLNMQFPPLTC